MPEPMSMPAAFTPYTESVRSQAGVRLRALLGLDDATAMAWRVRGWDGPAPAHLEVEIGEGEALLELDLHRAEPDRRAWVMGETATMSYRKLRSGEDPFADPEARVRLDAMAEAFRAGTVDGEGGVWADTVEAVVAHQRIQGVDDSMFRNVSWSEAGAYGTVRLGFRCNQDCSFCWQSRSWPDAPDDLIITWIDEMAAQGVKILTLTGGEPTLNKRLPEFVERAAKTHGMRVELQTNAIQMRKPGLAERLREAGLTTAFVSYHSSDPVISDQMTRAPGTHRGTVAGIEAMLKARLFVMLNCIIERQNFQTLPDHARDIVARFVTPFPDWKVWHVAYSHPCEYYDQKDWAGAVVPLDEVQPYLIEAALILHEAGVHPGVVGFGCGFPPCVFREQPWLLRLDTPERYAEVDTAGRTYAEACERCAMKPHCIGMRREYLETWGERGIVPFETLPAV
ncbi:MAG: radical SAM protein [Myxococcota bacterium]